MWLEQVTSREASEAIQWWSMEHHGERRQDWHAAMVAHVIASIHGARTNLEDFMPLFSANRPKQTEAEMRAAFAMIINRQKKRGQNGNPDSAGSENSG